MDNQLVAANQGKGKYSNNGYRPEIDGLRAVAVIAVIFNHLNPDLFRSGYLGVDIFFVISGYVITKSVLQRRFEGWRSFLKDFYARRSKRILPTLVVYFVIASLSICLVCPYPGFSIQTGIASLVGFSNISLLNNATNYFSEAAHLNIFLHTWSLSIEEQFYIIYSILLGSLFYRACKSQQKNYLIMILLVLWLLSFSAYISTSFYNEQASYFLMPTRMWQLITGCLVYLFQNKYSEVGGSEVSPSLWSRVLHCAGLAVFLATLSGCVLQPQISALLITFSSALIIGSVTEKAGLGRILAGNSTAQVIGKSSYSIYLWHWYFVVMANWTIGINRWTVVPLFAASLLVGRLSYLFVEKPFRYMQYPRPKIEIYGFRIQFSLAIIAFPLSLLSAAFFSLYIKKLDVYLGTRGVLEGAPQPAGSNFLQTQSCASMGNHKGIGLPTHATALTEAFKSRCFAKPLNKSSQIIAFVGDSHTGILEPIIPALASSPRGSFVHTRGGCPFPSQIKDRREPNCNSVMKSTEKYILDIFSKYPHSLVITGNFLTWYFVEGTRGSKEFLASGPTLTPEGIRDNLDDYASSLSAYLTRLADVEANLLLILPPPEHMGFFADTCTVESFRPKWQVQKICLGSSTARSDAERRRAVIVEKLYSLKKGHPNLYLFDPFPSLCDERNCYVSLNGKDILYRDTNHLSESGVFHVYKRLKSFIVTNRLSHG